MTPSLRGLWDSWGSPSTSDWALPVLHSLQTSCFSTSSTFLLHHLFFKKAFQVSSSITAYFLTLIKDLPSFLSFFFKFGHNEVLRGRGIKQINSNCSLEMEVTVCSWFFLTTWMNNLGKSSLASCRNSIFLEGTCGPPFFEQFCLLTCPVIFLGFLLHVYPSLGVLLEMAWDPIWIMQARMVGERSGWNIMEFVCWFKDPDAEGKGS